MENSTKDIDIKVAAYPFCCQLCDDIIRQGDAYVVMDSFKLCLTCGLPERRLRPLVKETENKIASNEKSRV